MTVNVPIPQALKDALEQAARDGQPFNLQDETGKLHTIAVVPEQSKALSESERQRKVAAASQQVFEQYEPAFKRLAQ